MNRELNARHSVVGAPAEICFAFRCCAPYFSDNQRLEGAIPAGESYPPHRRDAGADGQARSVREGRPHQAALPDS
jgi:hypothetical protein